MTLEACNERLNELREKMACGSRVESMLKELYAQRAEAEVRTGELANELYREQADVDRLTGGFWSIYYAVIGKKQDMLEKERAEVLKASMKLDTAQSELQRIVSEIDRLEWERQDVRNCEREFQAVLEEKLSIMKASGLQAERLNEIEEQKAYLAGQIREVNEAMKAGQRVTAQIERIGDRLDSADGYATWDMLGGGLIADIAKHSHLDEAQQGVARLEELLSKFRTELADISIQTDVQAQVFGFMRFADVFIDNFFTDWAVRDHIHEAQTSLKQTDAQVRRVMERLYRMERDMKRQMEKLESELRALAEREGVS